MNDILKISIEAARVNTGMTQEKAAKLLGISAPTLIMYEKGRRIPKVKMMNMMAQIYNIPFENLDFFRHCVELN